TGSLQPNRRFRVGGRIGGSVGIPPDFLHIGRTRQIFAVLFARRGRYTKLLSAPIMGGNENAVPIRTTTDAAPCGQASHSERLSDGIVLTCASNRLRVKRLQKSLLF
ncbi:hypothetical protein ACLE41_002048, partial [Neisseria gonorrhoeae]